MSKSLGIGDFYFFAIVYFSVFADFYYWAALIIAYLDYLAVSFAFILVTDLSIFTSLLFPIIWTLYLSLIYLPWLYLMAP